MARDSLSLKITLQYLDIAIFDKQMSKGYYLAGYIAKRENDFHSALVYYKNALKYYTRIGEEKRIADTYMSIGNIYRESNFFEYAINNYTNAIKHNSDVEYVHRVNVNLSKCYWVMEDWAKGKELAQVCADYFKGKNNHYFAESNLILGNIFFDYGKINTYVDYLNRSLSHHLVALENYESDDFKAMALNNIGNAYISLKEYKNADKYLTEAFQIQTVNQEIALILFNKGKLEKEQGNYKKALEYFN